MCTWREGIDMSRLVGNSQTGQQEDRQTEAEGRKHRYDELPQAETAGEAMEAHLQQEACAL